MNKEKEQSIHVSSELIAFQIAGVLSKNDDRYIDDAFVYQAVKSFVKNEDLIDDIYRVTIHLLEDKYGILFDVDKKVDI